MAKATEFFFKEGCFIEERHNASNDKDCSVARVRVEGEKTTKLHALEYTTERYIILEGSADVTVGDETWFVTTGDVVVIPPGVAQKITNLGKSDLIFLAVCSPRFQEENYVELKE